MQYQRPKGTFDILPDNMCGDSLFGSSIWQSIERQIRRTCALFCCEEIRTPIIEFPGIFEKSAGLSSEVVSKEMFTFKDKKGREICLRPEGTPPTLRAIGGHGGFSNGQYFRKQHRVYYCGPMFRYERPQNGRYRQFHQFGVELIGFSSHHSCIDLLLLSDHFLKGLNIEYSIQINTMGDVNNIQKFKKYLLDTLMPLKHKLSSDSQNRLEINPLRILDSKDPQDHEIVSNLRTIHEFIDDKHQKDFDLITQSLSNLNIQFEINPLLVRGLDYYNHYVFEFIDKKNPSYSIGGGGRYNNLIASMGFSDRDAIGFAFGLERVAKSFISNNELSSTSKCKVIFVCLDEDEFPFILRTVQKLRHQGLMTAVQTESTNLSKALKLATEYSPEWIVIYGKKEIESNTFTIKNNSTRSSQVVSIDNITSFFHTC